MKAVRINRSRIRKNRQKIFIFQAEIYDFLTKYSKKKKKIVT